MLLVVAHDAGGANILASYLAREEKDALLVLGGPAVGIFQERLGRRPDATDLSSLKERPSSILTGSGWSSDLEWQAIRTGVESKIQTVTFLDHWVNYRERFVRDDLVVLPDEIWVGDTHAHSMAYEEFPGLRIRQVSNPYFLDVRDRAFERRERKKDERLRILYAAEPIDDGLGFSEWDALGYFTDHLDVFEEAVKVTLRPHPSDPHYKYGKIIDSLAWSLGGGQSLIDELLEFDVVVGSHTMALAVGLQLGLRAISIIPPGHGPCLIPFGDIESFHDLVSLRS